MKVNMTPNPLDVVTIHASQGDTEARQWEFELHNNGELIDTSEITEQMFFKAYKGGTEQILPENTSTPVTSPFKGDIRYPQGLLTDQEFTYRESPAIQDGLARIDKIKGNTLVWNQIAKANALSRFMNVADDGVVTLTGTPTGNFDFMENTITHDQNHVYLFLENTIANPNNIELTIGMGSGQPWVTDFGTVGSHSRIYRSSYTTKLGFYNVANKDITGIKFTCNIFDLTAMFGAGNEPATLEEFTSLFPLPYYAYNAGTLLSFNGTGLKTVGKNLFDESLISQTPDIVYVQIFVGDGTFEISTTTPNIGQANVFLLSGYATSGASTANNGAWDGRPRQAVSNNGYVTVATRTAGTPLTNPKDYQTILYKYNGESVSYEPYTESTLSLPISTYFPTGMKSAGTVYDELTETKAATKIGSLKGSDIQGSVSSAVSAGGFHYVEVTGLGSKANGQGISNMLPIKNEDAWSSTVPCVQIRPTTEGSIRIYGAFTTFQEFQTQYASLVLYYELATPTETSFITASLVTENAEIPLSNEDGILIGKCTEQLSAEPGFHDAKIKLSDADGECYSNKLQLHVERSPQ